MKAPRRSAVFHTGTNQLTIKTSWKTRPCPRCGAGIGQSCRRIVKGKVQGVDIGGGYERYLKNPHDERRNKRSA